LAKIIRQQPLALLRQGGAPQRQRHHNDWLLDFLDRHIKSKDRVIINFYKRLKEGYLVIEAVKLKVRINHLSLDRERAL
jgi:hypothetical protein